MYGLVKSWFKHVNDWKYYTNVNYEFCLNGVNYLFAWHWKLLRQIIISSLPAWNTEHNKFKSVFNHLLKYKFISFKVAYVDFQSHIFSKILVKFPGFSLKEKLYEHWIIPI